MAQSTFDVARKEKGVLSSFLIVSVSEDWYDVPGMEDEIWTGLMPYGELFNGES